MLIMDKYRTEKSLSVESDASLVASSTKSHDDVFLPVDFKPTNGDVICSRGSISYHHAANIRLREVIEDSLDEYQRSRSKMARSALVSQIIASVQGGTGRFVRQDPKTHRWFQVGTRTTREKVGQAIRAAIRKRREQYNNQTAKSNTQKVSNDVEQVSVYSGGSFTPTMTDQACTGRGSNSPKYTPSQIVLDNNSPKYSPSQIAWDNRGSALFPADYHLQGRLQLRPEDERISPRFGFDTTHSSLAAPSQYSHPLRPQPYVASEGTTPGSYLGEVQPRMNTNLEGISFHERRLLQEYFNGVGDERLRDPSFHGTPEFEMCEPIALDRLQHGAPWIGTTHLREVRDSTARARMDLPRYGSRSLGVFEDPFHNHEVSSKYHDPVGLSSSAAYGHYTSSIEDDCSVPHTPPEDRPPVAASPLLFPDGLHHKGTDIAIEGQGKYLKDQGGAVRLTSKRGRKK
uniref:DUF6824 domain-containing protein n=2 Tax=Amphora coffeiformis TaxID=265554 RepID=A0A7S3KYM9_9STRA